ncbi:MAG: phosphopantetheine-binding protein [Bacteroidales bacterium]|nr:phosphopantetheine-binding protein [Bacteroidales bacterium]
MSNFESIKKKIIEIINENINNSNIMLEQTNEDLSQLGMDSITFIHIVVALEEAFNIEMPDELLLVTEMNTVEKITNIISSAIINAELIDVQE